ncbi:MAG: NUDIX domain-containing protein [Succinivibrio sp.]|nr:NUDIX domain-containing protein [Succinivibrio sp.]
MNLNSLHKPVPLVKAVRAHRASRIFTIEEVDLRFANGVNMTYERLPAGRGAVMALPYDGENFYLIAEYGVAFERYELGLVKGKIEAAEQPKEACVRELEEEIGLGCKALTLLKQEMTVAPGMLGLRMFVFLCEDLYPQELKSGDEPEPLEVIKVSPQEARDLVFEQDSPLTEARSIAAVTLGLHKLGYL